MLYPWAISPLRNEEQSSSINQNGQIDFIFEFKESRFSDSFLWLISNDSFVISKTILRFQLVDSFSGENFYVSVKSFKHSIELFSVSQKKTSFLQQQRFWPSEQFRKTSLESIDLRYEDRGPWSPFPPISVRGGVSKFNHCVLVKNDRQKTSLKPDLFPFEHLSAYFEQNWKPSEFSNSQRLSLNFFKSSLKLLILFRSRLTIFTKHIERNSKIGD